MATRTIAKTTASLRPPPLVSERNSRLPRFLRCRHTLASYSYISRFIFRVEAGGVKVLKDESNDNGAPRWSTMEITSSVITNKFLADFVTHGSSRFLQVMDINTDSQHRPSEVVRRRQHHAKFYLCDLWWSQYWSERKNELISKVPVQSLRTPLSESL